MSHEQKTFIGLLILGSAGVAAWWWGRGSAASLAPASDPVSGSPGDSSMASGSDFGSVAAAAAADVEAAVSWTTPAKGQVYESEFLKASAAYGLPAGLLSRVAYQESRYNPKAKSPVGALGLMQFMPGTAKNFGIDPLDPVASIWAAAKYLSQLYRQFGNWTEALAGYNWGQGNVARKGLAKAPTETKNYFSQILADLGINATIV